MLKSELIKRLTASLEAHGDGEVYVQDQYSVGADNRVESRETIDYKVFENNYEFTIKY